MRAILLIFVATISLVAANFNSEFSKIETSGNVISINLKGSTLLISTDAGEAIEHDLESNATTLITLPNIKNFFEDSVAPRVLSIDKFGDKTLLVGEGDFGKKILYTYKDGVLKKRVLANQGIRKALFIDENLIALASMSNEIYIYDLKSSEILKTHKFSIAALSDMEVADKKVVLACESGKVYIYDPFKDETLKTLDIYKDNVYDIEVAKGLEILAGGVDRRVVFYDGSGLKERVGEFLVYAVGISGDAKFGAFMLNERSDVAIFDTKSFEILKVLETDQSILNGIKFYKDDFLITSAYERDVKIWKLKDSE